MKIKKYREIFEESVELTQEQIDFLNRSTKGTWSVNPKTNLVDVRGTFDCTSQGLSDFLGVKFGDVSVNFYCGYNNIESLEGSPKTVIGNFYCQKNNLKSLKGSPLVVGGSYDCDENDLKDLIGATPSNSGLIYNFSCGQNKLVSLEGSPKSIRGSFTCIHNELRDLKGSPKIIGKNLFASNNYLTSLEGAPEEIGGIFSFESNLVSSRTLSLLYRYMKKYNKSYDDSLMENWKKIKTDDKFLLYREDFKWLTPEQHKKIQLMKKYYDIKDLI